MKLYEAVGFSSAVLVLHIPISGKKLFVDWMRGRSYFWLNSQKNTQEPELEVQVVAGSGFCNLIISPFDLLIPGEPDGGHHTEELEDVNKNIKACLLK